MMLPLSAFDIGSATMRAYGSMAPPGAVPTTNLMVPVSADAAGGRARTAAAEPSAKDVKRRRSMTFSRLLRGANVTANARLVQALCARGFMPAAFEIGGAHLGAIEQVAAGAAQRDLAVDDDIAAVGELQRMEG